MDCNSDNDGRYERLNFNYTEDDYHVADILVNLASLVRLYEVEPPPVYRISKDVKWGTKKRRSAWKVSRKLTLRVAHSPPHRVAHSPPHRVAHSPPHRVELNHNRKTEVNSPSSPLDYSPNQLAATNNDNNTTNIKSNHPLKNKFKKRKPKEWEDHIKELQQTKEQLMLSLETVKTYYRTVLEWNKILRAKRDEKNRVLVKRSPQKMTREFDLNKNSEEQQQFYSFAVQPGYYYPNPFLPASNGGGMVVLEGSGRNFDQKKVAMAAEARKRRMFKINKKKNFFGDKK